jgi:hypothetical protein
VDCKKGETYLPIYIHIWYCDESSVCVMDRIEYKYIGGDSLVARGVTGVLAS